MELSRARAPLERSRGRFRSGRYGRRSGAAGERGAAWRAPRRRPRLTGGGWKLKTCLELWARKLGRSGAVRAPPKAPRMAAEGPAGRLMSGAPSTERRLAPAERARQSGDRARPPRFVAPARAAALARSARQRRDKNQLAACARAPLRNAAAGARGRLVEVPPERPGGRGRPITPAGSRGHLDANRIGPEMIDCLPSGRNWLSPVAQRKHPRAASGAPRGLLVARPARVNIVVNCSLPRARRPSIMQSASWRAHPRRPN